MTANVQHIMLAKVMAVVVVDNSDKQMWLMLMIMVGFGIVSGG